MVMANASIPPLGRLCGPTFGSLNKHLRCVKLALSSHRLGCVFQFVLVSHFVLFKLWLDFGLGLGFRLGLGMGMVLGFRFRLSKDLSVCLSVWLFVCLCFLGKV